jgi:hypothetical protein
MLVALGIPVRGVPGSNVPPSLAKDKADSYMVNPDWLFVIDRDAAVTGHAQTANQLLDNELVRRTGAWSMGRVIYLDPVKMYLTSSSLRAQQGIVDELTAEIRKKSKF